MIKLTIMQARGSKVCVADQSSPVVPREGEWVTVDGREIEGRVKDVKYVYVSKPDAPRVLDHVQVTLDGWKTGFGKD